MFKSQPVTIYVRIRTQSENSQQQCNIKCQNQSHKNIPQLKLWRHREGFEQNIYQFHIGHLLLSTRCCRLTSPSFCASDKKQNVLLVIRYSLMITVHEWSPDVPPKHPEHLAIKWVRLTVSLGLPVLKVPERYWLRKTDLRSRLRHFWTSVYPTTTGDRSLLKFKSGNNNPATAHNILKIQVWGQ